MERIIGRPGQTFRALARACAGLCVAVAVALPAWAGEPFAITSADWQPDKATLRIEGTAGKPDDVVLVRDAKTKALLGSAAVRADGKWLLKLRSPAAVPARTMAELGANCVECDVSGPLAAR